MKKIMIAFIFAGLVFALTGCGQSKNKLFVLNWNDYINEDLIEEFEKEYDCSVTFDNVDSNETMYSNIKRKVAKYDIAVPSDYMMQKMYSENMIKKIDKSLLSNYKQGMFIDQLEERINDEGSTYKDYFIPYFWGSLGLMYSNKSGVKEAVEANGFKVIFEQNLLPSGSKVGMYECARDAFAAAEIYLGYSLNTTDDTELKACRDLIKNTNFSSFGTDDLKTDVASGVLDVALVYSGDFFDQRYQYLENNATIDFGLYAPTNHNNVFYDGFVIPETSGNTELAYDFINFFLDTDNSFTNTDYVGYAPVIEDVLDIFKDYANPSSSEYDSAYEDLLSIKAFNPALIVRGEVYKYISLSFDEKIEDYFADAKIN